MAKDILNGLPNIVPDENRLLSYRLFEHDFYAPLSEMIYDEVQSAFGIALHMHQPTIPAGHDDLRNAALISNLQYMMEHQNTGDNHNAPVFLNCYARLGDMIPEMVARGQHPRVMLDYSGNLLWGLRQMGANWVLDNLKKITSQPQYYRNVEWLGTMWSHAVVSSTPIPDIRLHVLAWLNHFGAIFGEEALKRVKGFSPPEMHLPIHPDICYEYVKTLKACGYQWLLVQEHTIEQLDGSSIRRPNFPHRLVAKNSLGQTAEITVLIKTQGSDTKLVAQMQPFYEAKSKGREDYQGRNLPPYCAQIGDGENGGVMMNEFPPGFRQAFDQISDRATVSMNGSEYLEFIRRESGIKDSDFVPVQPIMQYRVWEFLKEFEPGAAEKAIEKAQAKYHDFHLEKASWTSNINWVKGYENVLDPINRLSFAFHQKFDGQSVDTNDSYYQECLLYLLVSQTSCFRYWGQGLWTEYAKEICRRGMETLNRGPGKTVHYINHIEEKKSTSTEPNVEEKNMKEKIIQAAGKTWKTLGEKGEVSIDQLPKTLKEDETVTFQALGWLAREDKINYTTKNSKTFVTLIESELRAFKNQAAPSRTTGGNGAVTQNSKAKK